MRAREVPGIIPTYYLRPIHSLGSGFRPMELHHAQSSYTVSSTSSSPFKALLSTPFKKGSKKKKSKAQACLIT